MELEYFIDVDDESEFAKSMLPSFNGNKCYVPILLCRGGAINIKVNTQKEENQLVTNALVSADKCRIIISKQIYPEIKRAYLEGIEDEDFEIPLFDYIDSYCLEIPLIKLSKFCSYQYKYAILELPDKT